MPDQLYALGHSEIEVKRLMLQAIVLRPISERLLRSAGLARAMRVLDLGTGTGDVAMLAAEIVGPMGEVVAIDRSEDVLALAAKRSLAAGLENIALRNVDVLDFQDEQKFDLVVGRYVLPFQPNPVEFLRAAAAQVRPGGVLALHEIAYYADGVSLPAVPLWDQTWTWMAAALRTAVPHADAGERLLSHFQRAGLAQPSLFCETQIGGGPDSLMYALAAQTARLFVTQLLPSRGLPAPEVDLDTLEDRLRAATLAAHGQVMSPKQICAWVKL